jgi:hypothetical protein
MIETMTPEQFERLCDLLNHNREIMKKVNWESDWTGFRYEWFEGDTDIREVVERKGKGKEDWLANYDSISGARMDVSAATLRRRYERQLERYYDHMNGIEWNTEAVLRYSITNWDGDEAQVTQVLPERWMFADDHTCERVKWEHNRGLCIIWKIGQNFVYWNNREWTFPTTTDNLRWDAENHEMAGFQ